MRIFRDVLNFIFTAPFLLEKFPDKFNFTFFETFHVVDRDQFVASSWRILQAVHPSLPTREDLAKELSDATAAQARGYFLPDEDERLRQIFTRYLAARSALWQIVHDLRPHLSGTDHRIFALAFCAASMLLRSASFLLEITKNRPVVEAKLNEADPSHGIRRKSFTRIFSSLTSARWNYRYQQSRLYYEAHREEILASARHGGIAEIIPWLENEEPFIERRSRNFLIKVARYRWHSFNRRSASGLQKAVFHLFKLSGSAIAEMKQPFAKSSRHGKAVTPSLRAQAALLLQPGDILVTRHTDAMSNLFLPGFWPHAALYLGTADQRRELSLATSIPPEASVLEAKKDGVKYRKIDETLAVDAFVVLRPLLPPESIAKALTRACTHEGKLYDFVFDFRTSDRLVCTEVAYRAYHGIDKIAFNLIRSGGRLALPAEELIKQALKSRTFKVQTIFGFPSPQLAQGSKAHQLLTESLKPLR